MRYGTMIVGIALLIALCALPCAAQREYRQGNSPPGDYLQSCRNVYTQGDRLFAECRERDGDWRQTSLDDFNRCDGEIINDNGKLVCAQGGERRRHDRDDDDRNRGYYYRGGWQGQYPPGDYVQTCRNIYMQGNQLIAECQKRNGDWRRTTLDNVDRCTDQIVNNDGRLICPQGEGGGYGYGYDNRRQGGWQGSVPPGTYTDTCRNIHVEGDKLYAECQKRNGEWRQTSLDDFQRCTSAPANDNGRLVCGR